MHSQGVPDYIEMLNFNRVVIVGLNTAAAEMKRDRVARGEWAEIAAPVTDWRASAHRNLLDLLIRRTD